MENNTNISREDLVRIITQLAKSNEQLAQNNEQLQNLTLEKKSFFNPIKKLKELRERKNTKIEPVLNNDKNEEETSDINQLQFNFNDLNQKDDMVKNTVVPVAVPLVNGKKTTGLNKIKNLIATHFVDFTNNYGFKNKEKTNWYDLGYKMGTKVIFTKKASQQLYNSVINAFSVISTGVGIAFTSFKKDSSDNSFNLVGEQTTVTDLNTKFNETLKTLGFETSDLYNETKKENYLSEENLEQNIEEKLKGLKFIKQDGKYISEFLTNLDEDAKASTIHNILWPSLAIQIKEGMKTTTAISSFLKSNKYLSLIEDFAKSNNMSSDDVMNVLNVDPLAFEENHVFHNKAKGDLIKDNLQAIVDNVEKFTVLSNNNNLVTSNLIKATEDMKDVIRNLEISNERKTQLIESIDNSKVYNTKVDKQEFTYTYNNIKNNMVNLKKKEEEEIKNNMPRM